MKIRTKIMLPILFAVMVMVPVGFYVFYSFSVSSLQGEIFKRLETTTMFEANHIKTLLEEEKGEVELLTKGAILFTDFLKEVQNKEPENDQEIAGEDIDARKELIGSDNVSLVARVNKRISQLLEGEEDFYELFLLNNKGRLVATTNFEKEIGKDFSNDDLFLKAQTKSYVQSIHFDQEFNKKAYAIATPLLDSETGDFLGILAIKFEVKDIVDIVTDRTGLGRTGKVYLLNSEGYFLTPSFYWGEEVILEKKIDTQNFRHCLSMGEQKHEGSDTELIIEHVGNEAVEVTLDYRGVPIIGSHVYIPEMDWCLLAEIDKAEAMEPINKTTVVFGVVGVSALTLFGLIALVLSRSISEPIEKLRQGVKMIEQGKLDHKVGSESKDEIGQLSRSFDLMVASIKKARVEVDQKVKDQTKEIVDKQEQILGVLEDVEKEKRSTERERDKVSAILLSIGDGVFVVDKDLKIILFNQAAAKISGFSAKESIGKKYDQILKFIFEENEKVNSTFIKKAIETGQVQEMSNHTILFRKDGSKLSVADSAAPLKDKKGKVVGCVVVFRDVSKEREIDRMKTEFISLASHQLRTPLSAMRWFAEMLINGDAGKLNKEQLDFTENIYDSNQRMIELVDALLDTSRIESGRLIIDPKLTDLSKIVDQVVKELKVKIKAKKIKLVVSIHKQLPKIKVDPKLIASVYQNLISNAVKYTPKSGEISVFVSKKEGEILSQVTDSGVGIPKNEQSKIFEKFFRARNVSKLETEGTGLGLYLAKAVIESSGGKIWFKSKRDKGATFWFSLPLSGMKAKEGEVSFSS